MRFAVLVAALLVFAGCQPNIGDDCSVDSDCSQVGDRICDSTQPGGYCTIFNCDPTSCPADESVCVAFNDVPSPVAGCENPGRVSPYVRNFCMATCSNNGDCRGGYRCVDLGQQNPWGAEVIQRSPRTTKVCVYSLNADDIPETRNDAVCTGTDQEFPTPPQFGGAAGMSTGGASGANAGQGGSP